MPDDICANRHGGNAESVAAHESKTEWTIEQQKNWCLQQLRRAGARGYTCDELSALATRTNGYEVPPNRISGLLSRLVAEGKAVNSKMRRPTRANRTARVRVLPEFERPRPREVWHPRPGRVRPDQQALLWGDL